MEQVLRNHLNELYNPDTVKRSASLQYILEITEKPVSWASEVWEELQAMLSSYDNQERAIAVQVLANLAKNDPERIANNLEQMLLVTRDRNVQVAKDSLKSLWKVAIINTNVRHRIIDTLAERFKGCANEEHSTLIRHEIIICFRKIYDESEDNFPKNRSMSLITNEEKNPESRKMYTELWSDIIEGSQTKWENIDDVIVHYEKKIDKYKEKLDALHGGKWIREEERFLTQKIFYVEDFLYYLRKIQIGINKNYIHKSKLPENINVNLKSQKSKELKESKDDDDLVNLFRRFTS